MAEYNKSHEYESKAEEGGPVETQDRGLFDFLGKKKEEEKPIHHEQDEAIVTEFEKVKVSESEPAYVNYNKPAEHGYHPEEHKEEEKKHETLSEKLRRSDSSSSSVSHLYPSYQLASQLFIYRPFNHSWFLRTKVVFKFELISFSNI